MINRTTRKYSTLAVIGCFVALAAGAAGMAAGPAYRWGLLGLGDAFTLLRWAAYGGAAACVVCIAGLIRARPGAARKGFLFALAGLAAGALVFWIPFSQLRLAQRVPAIHDITTDTRNPPEFRAVLDLRSQDANSLVYAGTEVARRQREAYPHIRPAMFAATPDEVFAAAQAVAQSMGWSIVASSNDDGRIEAVDTTFWFGFKDDVVVRVTGAGNDARVDVRSVSRVGVSDLGKNADRIAKFLKALRAEIEAKS